MVDVRGDVLRQPHCTTPAAVNVYPPAYGGFTWEIHVRNNKQQYCTDRTRVFVKDD